MNYTDNYDCEERLAMGCASAKGAVIVTQAPPSAAHLHISNGRQDGPMPTKNQRADQQTSNPLTSDESRSSEQPKMSQAQQSTSQRSHLAKDAPVPTPRKSLTDSGTKARSSTTNNQSSSKTSSSSSVTSQMDKPVPVQNTKKSSPRMRSFTHKEHHLLPTCVLYDPNNKPRQITRYELAEHNEKCWSTGNWRELWTMDTQYVYNGYELYHILQSAIRKSVGRHFQKHPFQYGFWRSVSYEDCKPECLRILEDDHVFSLTMFTIKQLHISYNAMKNAQCETFIGALVPESDESEFQKHEHWLQSLYSQLETEMVQNGYKLEGLSKVVDRNLMKLKGWNMRNTVQGDLNKQEFSLPPDVRQSELRSWMSSWESFDTQLDSEDGILAREVSDLNDIVIDTHQVYSDMVAKGREAFMNTEIDGEAGWQMIPVDVIKNDETTENQDKLQKVRENKRQLSKKQMVKRHGQILKYLFNKYELDYYDEESYMNWTDRMISSWEAFQAVCETWEPDERFPVRVPDADIPEPTKATLQNRKIVQREEDASMVTIVNGVWDKFFKDRPNAEKLEELGPRSGHFSKRLKVNENIFEDDTNEDATSKTMSKARRRISKTVPRTARPFPVHEDEERTLTQLEAVQQDLKQGLVHGCLWQEELLKMIHRYLKRPTSDDTKHSQYTDPNKNAFHLPDNVVPYNLRYSLPNISHITVYQEETGMSSERGTFAVYDYSRLNLVDKQRPNKKPIEQSDNIKTIQKRRPRDAHRCSRSPDLYCKDCRGVLAIGSVRSSKKTLFYSFSSLDWSTKPPLLEIPREIMDQKRARIFKYYKRKYKYRSRCLDVYRDWAARMDEGWYAFLDLCQKD